MPLPDEIERDLAVIDRALAGEPVDPDFADLAELALLLADSRPALGDGAAMRLDRRISALATTPRRTRRIRRPRMPSGFLRPAIGAGLAVLVVLAVVAVVVLPRGSGSSSSGLSGSARSSSGSSSSSGLGVSSSGSASSSGNAAVPSTPDTNHLNSLSPPSAAAAQGATNDSARSTFSPAPTPQSNGRRTVQSSQLQLTAPGGRISTVAQELFNVVGAEQGIVKHSQVVSGSGGGASFTLSIPTANLSITLARLAALRYATVSSSTEQSTDVNSQYLDDQRELADARALRTSLLKQLQAATSTAAIDSLKAQISTAEATIAADEGTVNALQGRISYTAVSVQIDPGSGDPGGSGGGGFTIAKAGHDALDVLRVIAGVLLIALAVLVPLGLVAGAVFWGRRGWRRRRREQALDSA